MTMHLAHPSLSLNGKKKGKRKFRSAGAAAQARQQQDEWQDLKTRWGCENNAQKKQKADFKPYQPKPNPLMALREPVQRSSHDASWDPCVKNETRQYTGDKILGIGTLHKSNAVPVFSEQEAKDLSAMRR